MCPKSKPSIIRAPPTEHGHNDTVLLHALPTHSACYHQQISCSFFFVTILRSRYMGPESVPKGLRSSQAFSSMRERGAPATQTRGRRVFLMAFQTRLPVQAFRVFFGRVMFFYLYIRSRITHARRNSRATHTCTPDSITTCSPKRLVLSIRCGSAL